MEGLEIAKNKSLLLVILWKQGIPDWVRKTIWPLVIGNRLEVTQNLYEIQMQKIENYYQNKDKKINPTIQSSLRKLDQDMKLIEKDIIAIIHTEKKYN